MNKYLNKIFIIVAISFVAFPIYSYASVFNLSSTDKEVGIGNNFEVIFSINTEGEHINAMEGKIILPKNIKVSEIRDGSSIVSLWIERPRENNGEIVWSGIIPGGYRGDNGFIFSVVLSAISNGNYEVTAKELSALINDGLGTKSKTRIIPVKVSVKDGESAGFIDAEDIDIPESFSPVLSKDENIFDNKYFVAFSTQDKKSGIEYYEISEKIGFKSFRYKNLLWKKVESPYELEDQSLRSNVYVKAVDKKGNYRVAWISPTNPPLLYNYNFIFGIIIVLGAGLWIYIVRAKHAKSYLSSKKRGRAN